MGKGARRITFETDRSGRTKKPKAAATMEGTEILIDEKIKDLAKHFQATAEITLMNRDQEVNVHPTERRKARRPTPMNQKQLAAPENVANFLKNPQHPLRSTSRNKNLETLAGHTYVGVVTEIAGIYPHGEITIFCTRFP